MWSGADSGVKSCPGPRKFFIKQTKGKKQNIVFLHLSQCFLYNTEPLSWPDSQKMVLNVCICWWYDGSYCPKIQFNIYYQLLYLFNASHYEDYKSHQSVISRHTHSLLWRHPSLPRNSQISDLSVLEFNEHIFGPFRLVERHCIHLGQICHRETESWLYVSAPLCSRQSGHSPHS